MSSSELTAGDAIPPECEVIEVHVTELRQLFHSLDPAPFQERDLDPDAAEFIVSWARDVPRDIPIALRVHLDRRAGLPQEAALLRDAIHQFFANRSATARRQLRTLLRRGRISLLIGLAFLTAALSVSELLERWFHPSGVLGVLRESLTIGGWVAMWRPLEILLYDWWPLRADARLLARLATVPVSIRYGDENAPDTWQQDWPVLKPHERVPA